MSENKVTVVNRCIFWKEDWMLRWLKDKKTRWEKRKSKYENGILKEFLSTYYETQELICDAMIESIQTEIEDRVAELYCVDGVKVVRTDGVETL